MRKFVQNASIIIFITISLLSCSNSTKVITESKDLIPLRIGNEWIYTDSIFDNGKVTTKEATGRITKLNTVKFDFKEYKYFTQTEYDSQNKQVGRIFIGNEPDGLYNYGSKTEPEFISFRDLLLRYPVELNSSWNTIYHFFDDVRYHFYDDTCDVKCVAVKELITVPAGTFSCYKYQYTLKDDIKIEEYWKIGTGMVAYIKYEKDVLMYKRVLKTLNLVKED
jgi:hypothetical protein